MHASGNLSGYAWADESIGWVSLHCSNAGVCGVSDYGVTVAQNGMMSGYAWANSNDGSQSHIGWINFAPSGPYPASSFVPNQSVRMNPGTGEVRGWARLVNYDAAGGWDGWIGFGSGGNYGSGVTVSGCNWDGYTWGGGTVIGWIHFRGSLYGVSGSGNGCATTVPAAPSPLSVNAASLNVCRTARLTWANVAGEDRYEVERKVSSDSDAQYIEIAEPSANTASFTDTGTVGGFSQNTGYTYRARACNSFGCSGYSNAATAVNQSPNAAFSWSPASPPKNINTLFDASASTAYSGSFLTTYSWAFTDGTPASAIFASPTVMATTKFALPPFPSQKPVTLLVTDSSGRQCSLTQDVPVRSGFMSPGWIEIAPQ